MARLKFVRAARTWEGDVALFVLLIVGIVVAQTWIDFRDANKDFVLPDWARGAALAAVVATLLTGAASFASSYLQEAGSPGDPSFVPRAFWPELALVVCAMAIMVAAMKKNRLRIMMLFIGLATAIFVFIFRFS